jgi:hypothetical protein
MFINLRIMTPWRAELVKSSRPHDGHGHVHCRAEAMAHDPDDSERTLLESRELRSAAQMTRRDAQRARYAIQPYYGPDRRGQRRAERPDHAAIGGASTSGAGDGEPGASNDCR